MELKKEKKDVFGLSLEPGDIVAYPSSKEFFVVVIRQVVYSRAGYPLRIRIAYPHYNDEERIVKRAIGTDLDLLKLTTSGVLLFEGATTRWRRGFASRLLALSQEIRLENMAP